MANVGYTLMTEQAGPKDLVRWAARAEDAGFDLLVSSDHYFPWLGEQGHAPNAWVTLGAVAQATERAELMTYVTCPTMRYHPAVVAQQAATLALLSDNRFTLGLGAGENLNEHVIGKGWPRRGPAPGHAHRGGEHHPGPAGRRVRQLPGLPFPGGCGPDLGPARPSGAAGCRGVRTAVV
jgi:alkanesulfonate monooxygenase SsuD/methylene tetrahydromethanopterin reductase-like flavin-dependent oxidoreductase (luciferase family)